MNLNFLEFIKKKIITYNFKKFNKKIFFNNISEDKRQILVEFNAFHSDHVMLSYISNYLAKKYKSKIVGFYNFGLLLSDLKYTFIKNLKWNLGKIFNYKNFGVYYSFGVNKIFKPEISKLIENEANIIFKKKIKNIKKKKDIYSFKIKNIKFGDLFYDTYLKRFYEPSIDINSEKFKGFFLEFIKLIVYWQNYLNNNNVKAIVGVHAQYSYGIIHRIAVYKNILCILHFEGKLYKLSKKNLYQHNEYKYYKSKFNDLPKKYKSLALERGEEVIKKRIGGASGAKSGHSYISKTSFSNKYNKKKLIKKNNKLNVLITTQDFFDAINVYGPFHFNDFYEWLDYLGNLSKKTNYNWYIKDHPNYSGKYKKYQPFTANITDEICKKYSNIIKLPSNTSHKKIISEGIDIVLTVFGSVQFEYPLFNIPVLTASKNIPTSNYSFCINSKNIKQYRKNILNLKKIKLKTDLNQIKEFYFMNFVYHNQDIFYPLYKKFNLVNKKWDLYWSEYFYKFWYSNFSNQQHLKIYKVLDNFIKSKDITINITHLNDKKSFEKFFKKI